MREHPRINGLREIAVRYEGKRKKIAIRPPDISARRMFINTDHKFPKGAILKLRFRLATSGVEIETRSELRYCLPGVGVGVEFIEMPQEPARRRRNGMERINIPGAPAGCVRHSRSFSASPSPGARLCYYPALMRTGIIGLPFVGKTSLFRILTRARVEARGAPAQTHVGMARVPDARVAKLAEVFKPKKVTYAAIEYVDVGGLQKDREKNSASLVPLREADALANVVRLFEDPAVPHEGPLDALRDIESVELELILNDLDQVAKRIERVEKDLKKKKDTLVEAELHLLTRCRQALEAETPLRELEFKPEEERMLIGFMFLSRKPMLFVLNLGDEEAPEADRAVEKHHLEKLAAKPHTAVVPFCGKIEAELADLDDAEAAEMMRAYGLAESGRDRLIQATYKLLGLISFLTCGEPECRAWTIERVMTAQKAAGAIHSDIEKNFIKAEVVNWENLLKAGSFPAARERGQIRLEGKEYIVQDGDVILFRHSG